MQQLKKRLITHILKEGIDLRTNTKARGNLGLYSENRIDIHKKLPDNKFIEVLLHEYAHVIHKKLEIDMAKTGGNIEVLFKTDETDKLKEELINVTKFVDENALLLKFEAKKYLMISLTMCFLDI